MQHNNALQLSAEQLAQYKANYAAISQRILKSFQVEGAHFKTVLAISPLLEKECKYLALQYSDSNGADAVYLCALLKLQYAIYKEVGPFVPNAEEKIINHLTKLSKTDTRISLDEKFVGPQQIQQLDFKMLNPQELAYVEKLTQKIEELSKTPDYTDGNPLGVGLCFEVHTPSRATRGTSLGHERTKPGYSDMLSSMNLKLYQTAETRAPKGTIAEEFYAPTPDAGISPKTVTPVTETFVALQ